MVFTPSVIALSTLNFLFLIFSLIALFISLQIALFWNIDSSDKRQYTLEKRSYLSGTIIQFIFFIKIPLTLFFIFTLDDISSLITGAMCAVGVVDATVYGTPLLALKILNIYLFALWLTLHKIDSQRMHLDFTKLKSILFLPLFFLLTLEISLETLLYFEIDVDKMVSCCGNIFSAAATTSLSLIFAVKSTIYLILFFANFFLLLLLLYFRKRYFTSLFSVTFILLSIIVIILVYSPYIYELPTHHCPFCILQKEYYYVGYLIYSTLFLSSFYALSGDIFNSKRQTRLSIVFLLFFFLLLNYFPVKYYLINGVLL